MTDHQTYKIKNSFVVQLKDTKIDMNEFDSTFEGNGYIGDEVVGKIRQSEFNLAKLFAPKKDSSGNFFELIVFKSGVFIIATSADKMSKEDVDKFVIELIEKCETISKKKNFSILEETKYSLHTTINTNIKYLNYVAIKELERTINLIKLSETFSNTEYQPEEFSLLVFRLKEPKSTVYVSEDGLMLTENKDYSVVLAAFDKVSSYFRKFEGK